MCHDSKDSAAIQQTAITVARVEEKVIGLEKRMDSFSDHKKTCDERFTTLETHKTKVLTITSGILILLGYLVAIIPKMLT